MGPENPLPYNTSDFTSVDTYIDSLLDFVGKHELLRTLCGGVHILDFFTSDPGDIYSKILPQEWRDFFAEHDIMSLLDLFMREDLKQFSHTGSKDKWRNASIPPESLLEYLKEVRRHLLDRRLPISSQCSRNRIQKKLSQDVMVGMTLKKIHEVGLYASYLDDMASAISSSTGHNISHLIDFGSGQNYLGRALASEPYHRDIIAIESKAHNEDRAKWFDARAKLAPKQRVIRNKKAHRAGLEEPDAVPAPPLAEMKADGTGKTNWDFQAQGRVQYVSHQIHSGDLQEVLTQIPSPGASKDKNIMVISLHSCGNLVHHGFRSLISNPEVKALAMVGCCYNLLTERLGPATYKLPELRPTTQLHPRLRSGEEDCGDPDGFPMSRRFCDEDVRFNITARMMAVQAPGNWGPNDSGGFFKRHFYRALLQRVFLDRGIVSAPKLESVGGNGSPAGHSSSGGTAIIIGTLRKACYENFVAYVRGALEKLYEHEQLGVVVKEKMSDITDEEIIAYEKRFQSRKKDLSIIWSLMAFSAGVVEAAIVVDRWLWLREQEVVGDCWVESVFEYRMSPRNLVVVAVKKS